MATPTYDLLDSTTLASTASSITFSGISGSYRDLVLVADVSGTAGYFQMRFNSDTGSNYSYVYMQGTGSAAASGSGTPTFIANTIMTAGFGVFQIMDYSATDKHKTVLFRDNSQASAPFGGACATAARWASTSAITTIQVLTSTGSFAIGSTFYLYGIAS